MVLCSSSDKPHREGGVGSRGERAEGRGGKRNGKNKELCGIGAPVSKKLRCSTRPQERARAVGFETQLHPANEKEWLTYFSRDLPSV